MTDYSYEEIRGVVLETIKRQAKNPPDSSGGYNVYQLRQSVINEIKPKGPNYFNNPQLSKTEEIHLQEIFWELFRQGLIILGYDNDPNSSYP